MVLERLPPTCNVLFSTLPGTTQTNGLIDSHKLGLLPKEAIVVNIGRGSVFVEKDLFDALNSKHLFGAGLDVWWSYPHRGGGLHTPEVEEQRYVDLEEIMQEIRKNGWESIKSHPNIYHSSLGY